MIITRCPAIKGPTRRVGLSTHTCASALISKQFSKAASHAPTDRGRKHDKMNSSF